MVGIGSSWFFAYKYAKPAAVNVPTARAVPTMAFVWLSMKINNWPLIRNCYFATKLRRCIAWLFRYRIFGKWRNLSFDEFIEFFYLEQFCCCFFAMFWLIVFYMTWKTIEPSKIHGVIQMQAEKVKQITHILNSNY